jgi:hypothetical protein
MDIKYIYMQLGVDKLYILSWLYLFRLAEAMQPPIPVCEARSYISFAWT